MDQLLQMCKKENIELEILEQDLKREEFLFLNGTVKENIISDKKSYQLKAIYKGKLVTLNVDDISDSEKIIFLIKDSWNMLDNEVPGSIAVPTNIDILEKQDEKLDYIEIKKQFLSLFSLKDKYPEISSIQLQFTHDYETIILANTNDVYLKESNSLNAYFIEVVAKEDDKVESKWLFHMIKPYNFDQIKMDVQRMIEEVLEKLNPVVCVSGKYPIIIKNNCMAKLIQSLSSMFFAETINQKTSFLADKYNEKVFSDKITIIEDPTKEDMLVNRHFDDEGTKTFSKKIIDKGVFITKLYDNQEAEKDHTVSTGNSYGVCNMYIEPGEKSFDLLLKEMKNGVVIDEVISLGVGIDKITGQISIPVAGYQVVDGKREKTLKQFLLSTTIDQLFNDVKEVGADLMIINSKGGSPSILFDNMTLVGDKNG